MDAAAQRAIDDLTQAILRLQTRVDTLQKGGRGGQLANSSLEEGQVIEVRDDTGAVRRRWGWINGAVGEVTEGGDPVNAPSVPLLTPSLGGVRVTWDGLLAVDEEIPADFDHMAVHVSTSSGFTPSAATFVGNIRRAGEGGMLPVVPLPYVPHYVALVPVTTGGVQGVPSAEAVATPLQTSGIDLQADSVEAVHIKAGAVEADKLEAILVLASTIVAGIPGAARVEMDQDGLRGYNTSNALIFAIDSSGNAVFSGDITASEITGSRFSLTSSSGATAEIAEDTGTVRTRVVSGAGQRSQMLANATQAEFSAWSDPSTPGNPVGAFLATDTLAVLTLQSASSDGTQPWAELTALDGQARGRWYSGSTGSEVLIRALPDHSSILLSAPKATDPNDLQGPGFIFTQRYANDIAATSVQSPVWSEEGGLDAWRSMLHVEGARPDRAYTVMGYAASRHLFQQQWNMDTEARDTADGVVELASTHSISAERHRPASSSLGTPPTWTSPTTGSYVDFTGGEWPAIAFKTGWSGLVEITILMAAQNPNSDASSISVGFRLSGSSSLAADLSRCALVRSLGTGINATSQAQASYVLQLNGNADYTLTPAYRLSSWNGTRPAFWDSALPNTITVRALT